MGVHKIKEIKYRVSLSGCHEVIGRWVNRHGYPTIRARGKNWHISRFIATWFYGSLETAQQVCHTCDNRLCININHLFIGSIQDNQRDKRLKGRSAKGLSNVHGHFTESEIRFIRQSTLLQTEIAALFGVTKNAINCIVKRRTYKWVL